MPNSNQLNLLIENFLLNRPIRAGSLIITLYGDAIVPRGGVVWLGSLVKLLSPIGINERLVRTSVFRLANESWLQTEKVGRRSHYSLTASGMRRFERAFKYVYEISSETWNGSWCLLILSQLDQDQRKKIKDELKWQSFGQISNDILLHPRVNSADLVPFLQEWGLSDRTIVFQTEPNKDLISHVLRSQVEDSWNIQDLATGYRSFLNKFRPIWHDLNSGSVLSNEECFLLRLLLIHEYRKVVLRDPQLPDALLPSDWEGRSARQLCRNLYRLIYERAELWLDDNLENALGPLQMPNEEFFSRFGGLR